MNLNEIFNEKFEFRKVLVMVFLAFLATVSVLILRQSSFNEIPVSPEYRRKGPDNAKIKIIEFSDFGCPACAMAHFYLSKVMEVYKDNFQINYKYFPLTMIHPNSFLAAINAECAGKQNKFWEFADILFKEQDKWSHSQTPQDIFMEYARTINLNLSDFENCVKDKEIEKNVNMDISYGDLKNVDATPTFFINNERAVGAGQLMEKIRKFSVK